MSDLSDRGGLVDICPSLPYGLTPHQECLQRFALSILSSPYGEGNLTQARPAGSPKLRFEDDDKPKVPLIKGYTPPPVR